MPNARIFTFNTWNVGDEMQSYAVLAHLQRAQGFADRDTLALQPPAAAPFYCVMNSWFMLGGEKPLPPAPNVLPIWHGFCAGREDLLNAEWQAYLRAQQQSIGCRDTHSVGRLQELGIPAHWTGCLTLFLGTALSDHTKPRGENVIFVDVPPEAEVHIPDFIRQRAIRLSTFPPPTILHDAFKRWAYTAWLADQLSRAALVVSRRLHVVLPAASFSTPTVAVPDPGISLARRRFSGFESIMPTVFLEDTAQLAKLDWRHIPPPVVPNTLSQLRFALQQQLLQRGLLPIAMPKHPLLDNLDYHTQRIYNAAKLLRPGRIRLRLAEMVQEMAIRTWSEGWVDIALQGFPGLRKMDVMVEATVYDREDWVTWGSLHDLVMPRETFL